ncbi:putative RRM domain-containing protein [Seiridium cardinale]
MPFKRSACIRTHSTSRSPKSTWKHLNQRSLLDLLSVEAANRFLARHNQTCLIIKGRHARVVRHHIHTLPLPDEGVDASRVPVIRGDPEIVETLFLISILEMEPRIHYQTDFYSWVQLEEQNTLIWHFESFRA